MTFLPTTGVQFVPWVDTSLPIPGANGVPDPAVAPAQTAMYLNGVRDTIIASQNLRPLIRITDGSIKSMWELDGEISASVEELIDDTGKLTVTVGYQNWMADLLINQTALVEDINILVDWNPLNPNWRTRWGGKVVEIHVKKDAKGIHTLELTALHFREHAKRLLVAANPIFPPELQLPRMWVLPGPARSICALTAFVNLARLFMPALSIVTNVFNPLGWINPLNPDAALNLLPTEWPIQVAFVDPALDQSRWTSIGATWTTWHETFKDVLMDAGVAMKCYTYLTTDADSPNTELVSLLEVVPELISQITGLNLSGLERNLANAAAPLRNAIVFAFEQIDGVTGPTGTVADGLLSTVAVTLDDLITPVAVNLATGAAFDPGQVLNGAEIADAAGVSQTRLIEQLLNVAPAPPRVIWWDGTYNGMINTDLLYHKGAVKTIMTGSKSPALVNEAQTFAIRYALSQLQIVIAPGFGLPGGPPIGAGLDSLYQGQLDNSLFAWERFTDPVRALYGGDMAFQEHFERGSGTAYTLSSILTLRSGNWKTRAWASFSAVTLNGHPWIAGYDYHVGDRVGFEQDGIIYVDNVYGIKREWDWQRPLTITCKIGDGRGKDDPFGAAFKTIANMYSFVSALAGEGTLFQ